MEELILGTQDLINWVTGPVARQILQLAACLYCLYGIGGAVYYGKKRGWDALYFILLCASVVLWAGGALLAGFAAPLAGLALQLTGIAFVPALTCLHIWKQVYYKEISIPVHLLVLITPAALSAINLYAVFTGQGLPAKAGGSLWLKLVFLLYTVLVLVRAFMLCLNVFYQMPRHMRKSTYSMLGGLAVITGFSLAMGLLWGRVDYDFLLLATLIAVGCFYRALKTLSSANVIATSRDFVFGSLGTTVLVLSKNGRILDWNKKGYAGDRRLPPPKYKELFSHYRKRIIEEGNGRVSPHDDNLITTYCRGTEYHYLFSLREIGSRQRKYGQLAEITEVTPLYAKFRYLEEIATVDQLTGLYNRNAYINMVKQLVAPDKMPLLVLVGDVNNLKQLNDSQGHLHGDTLLVTVAKAMKNHLPEGAAAFRIGGDEFVILVPNGLPGQAQRLIEGINRDLAGAKDSHLGTPSVSWGFAQLEQGDSYNEIFSKADKMMYVSKKATHHFQSSGLVPNDAGAGGTLAAPAAEEVQE